MPEVVELVTDTVGEYACREYFGPKITTGGGLRPGPGNVLATEAQVSRWMLDDEGGRIAHGAHMVRRLSSLLRHAR